MEAVSEDTFLEWATGVGVAFDPGYPDAHYLSLVPPSGHARFWVVPGDPGTWPHFVTSLLQGLDKWTTGFLWPRAKSWPRASEPRSPNERVRNAVLQGLGIPDGWAGAIRFGREEEALVAVMFVYLAFGWCGEDDLFFVPDHGRQVLQTDHHDVIHVECASEARVRELVTHMARAGYDLPTEPPDWTFKRPAWMTGNAGSDNP